MKKRLQQQLIVMACYGLIGIFLQCLLLNMVFASDGNAQDPESIRDILVDVTGKDMRLKEVFKRIENQTSFEFSYDAAFVDDTERISINIIHKPLFDVLAQIAIEKKLSFKRVDNTIFIKKSKKQGEVEEVVMVKAIPIEGRVTSAENGEPLPGVNVMVKNTNIGTVTDVNGKYNIVVPDENNILIFSFIGFTTQEVFIDGKSVIDLAMAEDAQSLEEVVVVGYGTQRKVNLTGAVDEVSSEILEGRPVANISQAIQGVIPNLNITPRDGRPGKIGGLNIRGNTSINGGEPLVLIDGIPGEMDAINPRDVESISILKDAASAAIYGARGAFGVILITTKKGKKEELTVNYHNNFGISSPTVRTDYMTDPYDVAKLHDEAFQRVTGIRYTGYTDDDYEELLERREDPSLPSVVIDNRNGKDQYIYYGNTDWYREFFRDTQTSMEHALSLTGGSDKIDILLSGRFYEKNGIYQINQDKFTSYNLRSRLNAKVSEWLTINNDTRFNNTDYAFPGWGDNWIFVFSSLHALPSYVPRNPDGTATFRTELNSYAIGDGIFADLLHGKSKGTDKQNNFLNTVGATLKLHEDLDVIANYTYSTTNGTKLWRRTEVPWSIYPGEVSYIGYDRLRQEVLQNQYHVINAYANYKKSIGRHSVEATTGINQELKKFKHIGGYRNDLLSEELNEFNLGSGEQQVYSSAREWSLFGVFYRLNYNFDERYLLEFNGRYDGTSRFPKGKRFGFFPSVSAGWRISEESFYEPIKNIMDEFKIRASYGTLGNQQTSTYGYISTLRRGRLNYLTDGAQTEFLTAPNPISPSLTWEKSTTKNIGVDMAFLRNKLNMSLDVYTRDTKDMLTKGKTLPGVFGAPEPQENAADLRTKGLELSVSWRNKTELAGKTFSYSIGAILSDYTSKITRFDNPTKLLTDYYEGQELGEIWGYKIDGFFESDKEALDYPVDQTRVNRQVIVAPGEWGQLRAGDLKFVDVDGDGSINVGNNTVDDHGDLIRIGNSQPRYSYGFNLSANWNGFDISAIFQGIGKQNWYPDREARNFWGPYNRPYTSFLPADFVEKVWTPDNPDAYFPLLRGYAAFYRNGALGNPNDRYLQDLAYIRLKNINVGYTLPTFLTDKLEVGRCRIYVSGENIFTLTKLKTKYIDPEQAPQGGRNRGTGLVYPFSKTFSIGLDISF